jgi:hypothetical protein
MGRRSYDVDVSRVPDPPQPLPEEEWDVATRRY